jgi:hypothetical protein
VLGCAAAPAGPRGPLLGRGVDLALDYSYAYGAGSATLADGTPTSGGADVLGPDIPILPRRLELRASPLPWADVGGQIGWLGGGFDARVGLPAAADRKLALNLAVGYETGDVGPFKDAKPSRSRWLRLEAYPMIPNADKAVRLVLAVGVNTGTFYHELSDPRPDDPACDTYCPDVVGFTRRETRLETSAGVFLQGRPASFVFTASPYFVLDAGAPQGRTAGEEVPASHRQAWGIVFVGRWSIGYHR